jgi:hypothetical protein
MVAKRGLLFSSSPPLLFSHSLFLPSVSARLTRGYNRAWVVEWTGRPLAGTRSGLARVRGGLDERKVRAPQDTVMDNFHRPRG